MSEPDPALAAQLAAALLDLDLPDECLAGVNANLALLSAQWRTLDGDRLDAA